MDWVVFLALVVGGCMGLRVWRKRVGSDTLPDELERLQERGRQSDAATRRSTRFPEWVHRPRDVADPPLARRAAVVGCVAFALTVAGFAIGYSDHRPATVDFLHGLAIILVPIALLVAVWSRAMAKESVAQDLALADAAVIEQAKRLGEAGATARLARLLDDPWVAKRRDCRRAVINAFVRFEGGRWFGSAHVDPKAIPALSRTLRTDPDTAVRRDAVTVLALTDNASAIPGLVRSLRDDDLRIRELAAGALGNVKARDAVEPIGTVLVSDPGFTHGARALVAIRDAAGIPYLERAAERTRSPIRRRRLLLAAAKLRREAGFS